jgi:uncharacterized protein (DUF1330 family)
MMKTICVAIFSMLVGAVLGAAGIQNLHAQAKLPVYHVSEIEVTNVEAYTKEFVPLARASIKKYGGRLVAGGTHVFSIRGEPPKPRVAIGVWNNLDQLKAWYDSPEYAEALKIGDKYSKSRTFAVEALPQ